jgi:hypothetical protein
VKVIAVPLARCMWLIDFDKVNPRGRSLLDALHSIAKRYRFSKFPAHLLDYAKDGGLEFLSGTFIKGGVDLRVGMTVFNNGIQADTLSSTDDAEAFLEDVREWLEKEFNLPIDNDAIIRRSYQSQLDVQVAKELMTVSRQIQKIAERLTAESIPVHGNPTKFLIGGFSIFSEDVGKPGAPMPFRFERKWGTDFDGNIYFAQAQLRTSEHIALLEELERICS